MKWKKSIMFKIYYLAIEHCSAVTVVDPGVDPHGAKEPPFGLDLVLRSTDDRLNGTTLPG